MAALWLPLGGLPVLLNWDLGFGSKFNLSEATESVL